MTKQATTLITKGKCAYLHLMEKTNYLLFLLAAASLAMPYAPMRIIWTAWLTTWFLEFRFVSKTNIRFDKKTIPCLLVGIYFVWQALSYCWATEQVAAGKALERQLTFVILPFIALFGVNKNYNAKQIARWFVVGVFLTAIWYLSVCLLLDNYHNISQNKPYSELEFDSFIKGFYTYFNKIKHRFFFSTAATLASVVLFFYFNDLKKKIGRLYSWIFTSAFFVATLSVVILSGSRASIVTYLLLLFVLLCKYFIRKRNWVFVFISFFVFGYSLCMFYIYHPRMQNIHIDDVTNPTAFETDDEPRFAIWNSTLKHIDEYIVTGKGVGNSIYFLSKKFEEDNYPAYFMERGFHSHNQYLETLIESGILGLLLLLCTMFALVKYSEKRYRMLALFIVSVFCINFLSDTVIRPLEGVILFSFSVIFLLILNREEKN